MWRAFHFRFEWFNEGLTRRFDVFFDITGSLKPQPSGRRSRSWCTGSAICRAQSCHCTRLAVESAFQRFSWWLFRPEVLRKNVFPLWTSGWWLLVLVLDFNFSFSIYYYIYIYWRRWLTVNPIDKYFLAWTAQSKFSMELDGHGYPSPSPSLSPQGHDWRCGLERLEWTTGNQHLTHYGSGRSTQRMIYRIPDGMVRLRFSAEPRFEVFALYIAFAVRSGARYVLVCAGEVPTVGWLKCRNWVHWWTGWSMPVADPESVFFLHQFLSELCEVSPCFTVWVHFSKNTPTMTIRVQHESTA